MKISIVMPVRNAEPYLRQSIDSVLGQTLSDWELLCVNDSSTDGSQAILEEYAGRDNRIHLFRHEGNAGTARNLGLEHARGDYVLFLDADDFALSEMLETAYRRSQSTNADIVVFGGRRFDEQTQSVFEKREFVNLSLTAEETFSPCDVPDKLFAVTNPCPWGKLFSRDFLSRHQLVFQSMSNAEDLSFTLSALALAETISLMDADLVRHRVNTKTSSEASKSSDPLCFIEALACLESRLNNEGLLEKLGKAFDYQVLTTTRYNLDTVGTDEGRAAILDALEQQPFISFDVLGHDRDYYSTKYGFECAENLSAALRQRRTLLAEKGVFSPENEAPRVLVAYRGEPEPLVSIVVPVFNAEDFVGDTIGSLLEQTIEHIEIICVDDGSSDKSLSTVLSWADKDDRIAVIHQDNRGLSEARNSAMNIAAGKYLCFLDSDDMLAPDALKALVERSELDDLQVVLYGAEAFFESEKVRASHPSYQTYYQRSGIYEGTYTGPALISALVKEGDYRPSACLHLSLRSYVNDLGLRFHPGITHEDNGYTFALLARADRVQLVNSPLYKRRVREDSIMTRGKSFANAYGYYASVLDMSATLADIAHKSRADEECLTDMTTLVFVALHNAREAYFALPGYERGGLAAMPRAKKAAFMKAMDARLVCPDASAKIAHLRRDLTKATEENERFRRILAAPIRVKRWLRKRF